MVSFKMIARDVDSFPIEYRNWVVEDEPDYNATYYTGPKGGQNSLVDVLAFELPEGTGPVNFNLPQPTIWNTTYAQLPEDIKNAQLAVIDGYVYLFGGKNSDKIYRAPIGRPVEWRDTGARLPTPLYGSQIAIINDSIYLFGGNNGNAVKTIYSAYLSDPLTWTNNGDCLPKELYYSQLLITGVGKYVYLFGGHGINNATNMVFYAELSDPLTWYVHDKTLPYTLYGSSVSIIDNTVYLFGGMVESTINSLPSSDILHITLDDLYAGDVDWTIYSYGLPYPMAFAQFVTVGYNGYLIGTNKRRTSNYSINTDPSPHIVYFESGSLETYLTKIYSCDLSNPFSWNQLSQEISGQVYDSQLAVIYDRIFLFGANGGSVIFACDTLFKYNFGDQSALDYGDITRTQFSAADPANLFKIICFPPWKTDYTNNL